MKNIIALISFLLISITVCAQAPNKISYQALIRDAGGTPISSKTVSVKISIRVLYNGVKYVAYSELHSATTNADGLLSLEIGGGSVVQGNFSNVEWSQREVFVKTETDPNGGNNFSIVDETQMMSVPYALYAETAGNVDDADADPTNEIELPTNVTEGSIAIFQNGRWTSLPPGEENRVLKIVSGKPQWANEIPIPVSCEDGIQNGSELAVDCGPDCSKFCPGYRYDIKLISYDGASKLSIVKYLRLNLEISLEQAKFLVESAPVILFSNLSYEETLLHATNLGEFGGTYEFIPYL